MSSRSLAVLTVFALGLSTMVSAAPPGEVQNLLVAKTGTTANLTWDSTPGATEYEVLVSPNAPFSSGVSFLGMAITSTGIDDAIDPAPGQARFYLARAGNVDGWGSWGSDSSAEERLTADLDQDSIPDVADNCAGLPNRNQVDMDEDGAGDVCDNCPTEFNPGQEDGNGDGGGDACQPPAEVSFFCDPPFTPDPGVEQRLLDQQYPHPGMGGVVHPVIQFSMALMDAQWDRLDQLGIEINESISYNLMLASIPQAQLGALAAEPFVRSIFAVPDCYREAERAICDPLRYGEWFFVQGPFAPPARSSHALSYDAARQQIVLFGGDLSGGAFTALNNDTWEWNGSEWVEIFPSPSPVARAEHAMAWFETSGHTVMFGGLEETGAGTSDESDETWLFDGVDWMQQFPGTIPPARRGHAMAYDRQRDLVLMFGGIDDTGNVLGDAWVFDGNDWSEVAGGPDPRAEHAMAWDQGSGRVLMYGGRTDAGIVVDELWAWDGDVWERLEFESGPDKLVSHAMTSRWDLCGILLYGGEDPGGSFRDETWFWSGERWHAVQLPFAPGPLAEAALAYDAFRERYIMFGGINNPGSLPVADTLSLEPSTLYDVVFHQSVPSSVAASILSAAGAIVIEDDVQIPGGQRVNTWYAAIPESQVPSLALAEPVLQAQSVSETSDLNDGVIQAINADDAQGAPYCGGGGCDGSGIVVSQWETRWPPGDTSFTAPAPPLPAGNAHADLNGRVTVRDWNPADPLDPPAAAACAATINCPAGRCQFSDHATHVAGTMMGTGTGNPIFAGIAPNIVNNVAYSLPNSAPEIACELNDAATAFGARLANNSWGVSALGTSATLYNARSRAYDQQIATQPTLSVMFSAGNNQLNRVILGAAANPMPPIYTPAACTLLPDDVPPPPAIPPPPNVVANRFFTIAQGNGNPAKNTVTVGAVNSGAPSNPASYGRMTNFSSWGPTHDGRIKPDIVAAGAEDNQRDLNAAGTNPECPCGLICFGVPANPPPTCDPDPRVQSTVCDTVAAGNCLAVSNSYGQKRGTSMSAPAVTGGAALVLEEDGLLGPVPNDTALDADSLKALLIHTATDLAVHVPLGGNFMGRLDCDGDLANDDCFPVPTVAPGTVQDGPDYVNGWGLVNIQAALDKLRARNPRLELRPSGCAASVIYDPMPFNSPLAIGGDPASIGLTGCSMDSIWDWVGYLDVPSGTTQLKVTIVWNDPLVAAPATNSATPLLVNDLDLIVTPYSGVGGSPTGPHNYGWRLDPACPHRQAVQVTSNNWSPAAYSDKRNNVEQVIIQAPSAGSYRIVVQGLGLGTPTQNFAIMVSMPPSSP